MKMIFQKKGSTIINNVIGSFQKLVDKLELGKQLEQQEVDQKTTVVKQLELDIAQHQVNIETAEAVKTKIAALIATKSSE